MTERPMTRDQYRAAWRMARRMRSWRAFVKHAPRRFSPLTEGEAHRILSSVGWVDLCREYPTLYGDSTLLARTSRPYAAKRMREARASATRQPRLPNSSTGHGTKEDDDNAS